MRKVNAVFQSDGDFFVARCLDFPVTTQGKTLAVAKRNLQEAVALYIETWAGWSPNKESPASFRQPGLKTSSW